MSEEPAFRNAPATEELKAFVQELAARAEKLKNRFGDDVRIGRFAGFDLVLRPSFNNTVEVVVRGRNSYAARVTDTAQGTNG